MSSGHMNHGGGHTDAHAKADMDAMHDESAVEQVVADGAQHKHATSATTKAGNVRTETRQSGGQ